jgi:hypothetical protein
MSFDQRSDPLSLILLGCLLSLQGAFLFVSPTPILEGALLDTDAYMRLARVADLYQGGTWFDPTEARVGAAGGHVQHWTRPLDAILLAGAWALAPLLGFADGLHVWGAAVSPVFHGLALCVLIAGIGAFAPSRVRLFAGAIFLVQPAIFAVFAAGRPDHHSLLILLFTVLMVLTWRLLESGGDRAESGRPTLATAVLAGAAAALAVWVCIEALVGIAVALIALGLPWLVGNARMARPNAQFTAAAAGFLALALVLERGPGDLFAIEADRISIVHVTLLSGIALFWGAVVLWQRTRGPIRGPLARGVAAALGAGAVLGALGLCFPALIDGPLGPVDPLYERVRLKAIAELQPLASWSKIMGGEGANELHRFLVQLGILPIVAAWLAGRLRSSEASDRWIWASIGIGLLVFVPLGLREVRWLPYVQVLMVVPYAFAVDGLARCLTRRFAGRFPAAWTRPLPLVALAIGVGWTTLAAAPLAPAAPRQLAFSACPMRALAPLLAPEGDDRSRVIMTLTDYGPELLYRTPHAVLSIPNHRPQPGFAATLGALTATDDGVARSLIEDYRVDWILLCPNPVERRFFAGTGDAQTLYRRLAEGTPPPWLTSMPLPPDLAETVRWFEVAKPSVRTAHDAQGGA